MTRGLGWPVVSRTTDPAAPEALDPLALVQQFADAIPSPIFFKDAMGMYRVCNTAYEKLVGRTRSAILGKKTSEIFSPEAAAEHERYDRELWLSRRVQSYDHPYKAADGTVRRGLCRKALIAGTGGEPVGLIGIVTDITDLARAEEALRHSERRFRALTEHALDMVAIIDAEGIVRFVSPSVEQILGWTPVQLEGGSVFAYIHPDDANATHRMIARNVAEASGEERPVELRFQTRGGEWRTLEVIGKNRLPDPEVGGIVVHARDITQRRIAEETLRDSEERFRGVVENMPVLLAAASADLVPLVWNRECERVTGWRADEVVGNPSAVRMLVPDHAQREKLRERGRATAHDLRELEIDVTCRDGNIRTISWSGLSERFPVAGWAIWGVGRDVTAERQAQRAVAAASRLAAARMLASGVARNIENLVSTTAGNASLLGAATNDADGKRSLAEIASTAERAGELARQLQAYAEERRLPAEPTSVNDAVVEAVEGASRSILRKEIPVSLDLDPKLCLIEADPTQIVQLVTYLLANAVEATSGAGRISIRTAMVTLPEGDDSAPASLKPGTYVRLTIKDTGCGIDAATAARIFEPFYSTKAHGLGLGLPAAHGIVHGLGGAIGVDSRVGEGSTFRVYLPAHPETS